MASGSRLLVVGRSMSMWASASRASNCDICISRSLLYSLLFRLGVSCESMRRWENGRAVKEGNVRRGLAPCHLLSIELVITLSI